MYFKHIKYNIYLLSENSYNKGKFNLLLNTVIS